MGAQALSPRREGGKIGLNSSEKIKRTQPLEKEKEGQFATTPLQEGVLGLLLTHFLLMATKARSAGSPVARSEVKQHVQHSPLKAILHVKPVRQKCFGCIVRHSS